VKICIIGKYPPIQGGVSSSNYWLSRSLGERNHKVFVVTNAEEAGLEYKEEISPKEAKWLEPKNVKVVNTSVLNTKFVPYYTPHIATLAGLGIELVKKENVDVIYSNYLLPYGIAAYLIKEATGAPWFLDHAGSDITNLFDEVLLRPVFIQLFKKADLVVDSPQVRAKLIKTGIIKEDNLSPSASNRLRFFGGDHVFSPSVKPFGLSRYFDKFDKSLPVFTFLGKISQLKKTFSFVEAAARLPKERFYLVFVTEQGPSRSQLNNVLNRFKLRDRSCLIPFQPPWKIPSIMKASTCIVAPESEEEPFLPYGTHGSKICLEAMSCARCVIIGREMSKKSIYSQCKDGEHFLAINPLDIPDFSKKLRLLVDNPSLAHEIGRNARRHFLSIKGLFDESLDLFVRNLKLTIIKAGGARSNDSF
jgi:glycosyltransferase involved in cell wall biosynthesis